MSDDEDFMQDPATMDLDDISITSRASGVSLAYARSRTLLKKQSRIHQKSLEDYVPWPEEKSVDFVLIYKARKRSRTKNLGSEPLPANPRPYDEADVDHQDDQAKLRNRFHLILLNNGCELEVENFESPSGGDEYRAVKIHAVPFWMDYWAEKFLLMKPVRPPEVFNSPLQDPLPNAGSAYQRLKIKREWHNDFTNEDNQYVEAQSEDGTLWRKMKASVFVNPAEKSPSVSSENSPQLECKNEQLPPTSDLSRVRNIVSTGRSGGEETEENGWRKIRSVVFTEKEQNPLMKLIARYNEAHETHEMRERRLKRRVVKVMASMYGDGNADYTLPHDMTIEHDTTYDAGTAYRVEKTEEVEEGEWERSRIPKMLRNAVATMTDTLYRRPAVVKEKKSYIETDAYKQLEHLNKRHDHLISVRFVRWLFILIHGHNERLTLMQDSIRTRAIRAPFQESKKFNYLGYENDDFYTSSERSRMVFRILENAKDMPAYDPNVLPMPLIEVTDEEEGEEKKAEWIEKNWTHLGLQEMLAKSCYQEAFPIHAGDYRVGSKKNNWQDINLELINNPRKLLRYFWSSSKVKYKYQPLNVVKNYFGATTAMYFAFVGFYNMWLIGPAIIGIGVFIYGICQIPKNEMVRDICDSGKNFLMCPDCDSNSCDTYYLSDYCVTTAITSSANNGAVVVFSVVMMIWFAVFVSMWQRRQNTIAHLWGTTNSRDATAELRPKYTQTKTTEQRFNPVSGKLEVYVSFWNRLPQYTVAVTVVVMFLSCAALLLLSITIYNFTLYVTLRKYDDNSLWHKYAKELSSMITGSCSALVIQLLSLVYARIARSLTEWENHRTQRDFENHLTAKLYLFEFVNYYGTLFYISFIKGKFTSPTERKYLFPAWEALPIEGCAPGGCMSEVAIQMIIIMTVKQCIPIAKKMVQQGNLLKLRADLWIICCSAWCCLAPQRWVRSARERRFILSDDPRKQFIKDFELRSPPEMYSEYVDDIIQIGFLTMFVTAVPFAPMIALMLNLWQLRADATRYVKRLKRPVGFRSSGIGSWMKIIEFLCRTAILVNAVLIAFTFDYLPNLLYRELISTNGTLDGYVDFMMAHHTANISGVETPCRYWSYINAASEEKKDFWLYLWILRLGFVFAFQNTVWTIVRIIEALVPDTPKTVKERVIVEERLAQEWLSDDEDAEETRPGNEGFSNNNFNKVKKSNSDPGKRSSKKLTAEDPLLEDLSEPIEMIEIPETIPETNRDSLDLDVCIAPEGHVDVPFRDL